MKRSIAFLFVALLLCIWNAPLHAQNPTPASQSARLRVVTKKLEPFVMKEGDKWTGFSIELWDRIAQDLNLSYEWVERQTVDELLNAVESGNADVAIAGISMTPEREARIDFTHPYFDAGLQILVPTSQENDLDALARAIFSPFLLQILGVGVLITLVMAHIIWLVERRDDHSGSNPQIPRAYLPGVWEALWWAVTTLATGTYGTGTPANALKRLLAIFWMFFSIILIAQFTASITSLLTVQQLTSDINGPSDLPGKAIGTVKGSTAAHFLDQEQLAYITVERIEEAYELLHAEHVQAIVYDAPVLKYYAFTRGRGQYEVVGPIFKSESYGIALPTASLLREKINGELLVLKQNGTYDQLVEKWFGEAR